MTITYVGAGHVGGLERAAEASTTLTYPTLAAGDVAVIWGSVFNVSPSGTSVPGYTTATSFSATANTATPNMFIGVRVCDGSESAATVAVAHNNNVSIWQLAVWRGVDNTTPVDVVGAIWDASNATSSIPGVTTTTPGCALIYGVAHLNTTMTAAPATSTPGTFTEIADRSTGTRSGAMGYLIWAGSGATGTISVAWTGGAGRSIGVALALRPAAGSFTLAHIVETDTAWAVTGKKTAALAHIVETDTAWAVTTLLTAPAPWPTVAVECQFVAGVWTDITPWVRMVDGIGWGTRGRPDQYSTTQPNQAALTLDNRDGRFTAGNPSSPYYPNVKVGRRLRFTETKSSVAYPRYDGYVNEWPTTWGNNALYSQVRITATDRFSRLARARRLGSAVREETLTAAPVAYWPLAEADGSTAASDTSGNQAAQMLVVQTGAGGTLTFGQGVGPPTDGATAVVTAPASVTSGQYLRADNMSLPVTGGSVTLSCWFAATSGTVMYAAFGDLQSSVTVDVVGTQLELTAVTYDTSGASFPVTVLSPGGVTGGAIHHVAAVVTVSGSTTVTLYVDGVNVAADFAGSGVVPTRISRVAAGAYAPPGVVAGGLFTGTLAHVAVFGSALTAGQITAIYQAGVTGFAAETPDARVQRVGRYIGLTDPALYALDACSSAMAAWPSEGGSPLDLMQEAASAEDGQLFMSGNGKITLHSRTRRFNTTAAFTIHSDQIGVDTVFVTDATQLVNDAAYSRPGGSPQRAINAASVTDYDIYSDEQTYALLTDNAVLDRANWRVNTSSVPAPRCSQVTIDLLTQPALVTAVLTAEVSTRFTLDQLPSQAPASSVDLFIEGISETLSDSQWTVTFTTSAAAPNRVFVLNSSLLNGPDVLGY